MKRWLITIAIFLLAGAVVNVAVAVVCSGLIVRTGGTSTSETTSLSDADKEHLWHKYAPPEWSAEPNLGGESKAFGSLIRGAHALDFGDLSEPFYVVSETQAGWPMRCFRGGFYVDAPFGQLLPEPTTVNGVVVTIPLLGESWRFLPTGASWLGFAVNTLFYGALLWLLILGPFVLRRVIRVKRGGCGACGYDLHGASHDACPECGRVT